MLDVELHASKRRWKIQISCHQESKASSPSPSRDYAVASTHMSSIHDLQGACQEIWPNNLEAIQNVTVPRPSSCSHLKRNRTLEPNRLVHIEEPQAASSYLLLCWALRTISFAAVAQSSLPFLPTIFQRVTPLYGHGSAEVEVGDQIAFDVAHIEEARTEDTAFAEDQSRLSLVDWRTSS